MLTAVAAAVGAVHPSRMSVGSWMKWTWAYQVQLDEVNRWERTLSDVTVACAASPTGGRKNDTTQVKQICYEFRTNLATHEHLIIPTAPMLGRNLVKLLSDEQWSVVMALLRHASVRPFILLRLRFFLLSCPRQCAAICTLRTGPHNKVPLPTHRLVLFFHRLCRNVPYSVRSNLDLRKSMRTSTATGTGIHDCSCAASATEQWPLSVSRSLRPAGFFLSAAFRRNPPSVRTDSQQQGGGRAEQRWGQVCAAQPTPTQVNGALLVCVQILDDDDDEQNEANQGEWRWHLNHIAFSAPRAQHYYYIEGIKKRGPIPIALNPLWAKLFDASWLSSAIFHLLIISIGIPSLSTHPPRIQIDMDCVSLFIIYAPQFYHSISAN